MRRTLDKVTNCFIAEEFLTQIENLFLSTYKSEKKSNAEENKNECSNESPMWQLKQNRTGLFFFTSHFLFLLTPIMSTFKIITILIVTVKESCIILLIWLRDTLKNWLWSDYMKNI